MPFRPGEWIGEYEVQRLLGRGAHGVVLLVRGPQRCEQKHAMKLLHCDGCSSDSAQRARDAAFAEAAMLRRLRHAHVVGCRDVAWDAERQAVRMLLEFMDGGDLQGLIEARRDVGEPFEAHFARRVLAAVGGALAYVHRAGVLHRDVKPANVLLTQNSQRIKLADFGIAKLLEHTNNAHTVVGTPYYLSPEIVAGQAYGEASDAWALGVCLYEVMALKRPFDAGNQLALVRRICTESHDSLPETAPQDVARAAEGLLIKDQRLRMLVPQALSVSSAVAALTVVGTPPEPEDSAAPATALDMSAVTDAVLASDTQPRALRGAAAEEQRTSTNDAGLQPTPRIKKPAPRPLESIPGSLCSSWAASQGAELVCSSSFLALASADADDCVDEYALVSASEAVPLPAGADNSLNATWCRSEAVVAAREALSDEVDDPEELVQALASLERERETAAASRSGPESSSEASALDALESELRLRISALREDCAAMLDGLFVDTMGGACGGSSASSGMPSPASPSAAKAVEHVSSPDANDDTSDELSSSLGAVSSSLARSSMAVRGRAPGAAEWEHALEVATSLGVDTNQSEERIAVKRGMLSLRVKWGSVARFCMLPITVGFDSLVAEVTRRFGLGHGTPLPPLSWCEAGESFALENQASWEECLQRRGLVRQPGRMELNVRCDDPPPRPPRPPARPYTSVVGPGSVPPAFSVTLRRPDLFSWRMPSQTTLHANGTASASVGRRNLGQANRTPIAARSSSRCREALSTTVAPAAVDAPQDSEDEHDAAMKVQRVFRSNRDRLRAQEILQEEFMAAAAASRCSAVGLGCLKGYGTNGSLNGTRGYGMEFNRSSPTGSSMRIQRGFSAECSRWSPTGESHATMTAQGREAGSAASGTRPHVRCPRKPRTRGSSRTAVAAAGTSTLWTSGAPPVSRTLTSAGQAVGSGPQQPGGFGGPLPLVNGRALPR